MKQNRNPQSHRRSPHGRHWCKRPGTFRPPAITGLCQVHQCYSAQLACDLGRPKPKGPLFGLVLAYPRKEHLICQDSSRQRIWLGRICLNGYRINTYWTRLRYLTSKMTFGHFLRTRHFVAVIVSPTNTINACAWTTWSLFASSVLKFGWVVWYCTQTMLNWWMEHLLCGK